MKIEKDKYMDGYLNSNLDLLKQAVDKGWDGLLYVSGYEGDGKSTLASQMCYYLDNTINLDRVCFSGAQFLDACLNAKKRQAILFDESYLTFSNRSLWNELSKIMVSMLTMIRKKQLFIIIVAPTFFDIQKYIAIHRSRALIHIYSKGLERGYFAFYNRKTKHKLYIKGKREHDMSIIKPNFTGRFTKWFPFSDKEYNEKKQGAIEELKGQINKKKEVTPQEQLDKVRRENQLELLAWLNQNKFLRKGAITYTANNYFDLARSTLSNMVSKITKESK